LGTPTPVKPETSTLPAGHGLRFHHDQDNGPPGPEATQKGPEQPVGGTQIGAWTFLFEHGNLLSQGEDLKGGVAPTAEEDSECGQKRKDEFDHNHMVVTCRNAASAGQRLRIAIR
jgi:hypothetical protein